MVGAQDNFQSTPLHLACRSRSLGCANILLKNNASVDSNDQVTFITKNVGVGAQIVTLSLLLKYATWKYSTNKP